jgi:hypothetical protein
MIINLKITQNDTSSLNYLIIYMLQLYVTIMHYIVTSYLVSSNNARHP